MDVSAEVHIHVVLAQYRVKARLHIAALAVVFGRLGVDGVVADDYYPVLAGGGKYRVYPSQLAGQVLVAGIRIGEGVVAILVHHRRSVYADDAQRDAVILEGAGVVAGGHRPAAAHLRVVYHRLRVAAILVIAQDRKPVYHQLRVGVDEFEVRHPQWVVHRAHAFVVVHVSGGHHKLGAYFFGHHAHQFGYGLLVVVAVAAQVVGQVEVELVFEDGVIRNLCGGPAGDEQQGEQ